MKKSCFFLLLSLIYITINAQVVEKIYHFEEPKIVNVDGYSQIHFQGSKQYADVGFPSLPYQAVSLLLPIGCEAESVELQLLDFKEIDGKYLLYPYQQAIPYSHPEWFKFEKNDAIYASKGNYPERSHNEVTTHYLNGYSFAFLNFTPVQYVPSEGKVLYAQKVKVSVKTKSEREDHSSMLWNTPHILKSINNLAQNPEMISLYMSREIALTNYDILVITGENYVAGFDEYVSHYNSIGYRTEVATVEDIYSEMDGIDVQDKIRNYVIKEYQENGISMLILGGDVNIVPHRGFYCVAEGTTVDYNIPADLYYAALDGTWNENGNDRWGEPDEADMLPEIGVARMSFENSEEQEIMIRKTLSYQRNPVMGEMRNVTFGSEKMDDFPTYGGDFLELLIGERSNNGYTTNGIPEDYNITRVYQEHGNWSAVNMMNAVNQGTQYIHHGGHADWNFVAGWYLEDITNENFSGLNGVDHNFTFFHSHGCICGSFDGDCILERMINIDNLCVAVSGNSRYGWYRSASTEGPAAHLHRELVDAQYNDRLNNLAMSLRESKIQSAPWVGDDGAFRWNFYDLNALGDGAAPIWLDEPFQTVIDCETNVMVGTESVELKVTDENGNPMNGFRCSYYSKDEELLGMALTDENGDAEIVFESPVSKIGTAKLIVTGMNAFPNIKELNVYISNSPYITIEDYFTDDSDGQVDYNESHVLGVTLKNIGDQEANSVNMTLSCDKPHYVNITKSEAEAGTIGVNSQVTVNEAFAFTVCDSVPNNTVVKFSLSCTDGENVWLNNFNMTMNAPDFKVVGVVMDDSAANDNGYAEAGETVTLKFDVKNIGNSFVSNAMFAVFCSAPEIGFTEQRFPINDFEIGETRSLDLTFSIDESAENGVGYEFILATYSGNYIVYDSYVFIIGSLIEDFETATLELFDWEFEGTPWEITTNKAYQGTYCVKSGSIGHNQATSMYIDVEVDADGEFSFWRKISSEYNRDWLRFYIDGTMIDQWSGEHDWSEHKYILTAGNHTLKWTYSKDVSAAIADDCAYLDYIVFPAKSIVVDIKTVTEENIDIYPNPNNGVFTVKLNGTESEITVYNALGMTIRKIVSVNDEMEVDLSDCNSGLYFVNIKNDNFNIIKKVIKK